MFSFRKRKGFLLLIFAVGLNLVGRELAAVMSLPFWLDSVGTLTAAILMGPVWGGLSGFLGNFILGFFDHVTWIYSIVNIAVGVAVGYFYPRDHIRDAFSVVSTSLSAGLVAVIISTPLNLYLYDGYTGNIWGDALFDMLSIDIRVSAINSFLAEGFVDMPDKALSIVIAVIIVDILTGVAKRPGFLKCALVSLVSVPALLSVFPASDSLAMDLEADYETVSYDTEDGLATAEINALAQTDDGFLWAGTYSGLYRSDGRRFEKVDLDERIHNVMRLFPDSSGRLWIGTNDSGVACYDMTDGSVSFYSMDDGLAANAVRGICEAADGSIFIGTVSFCSVIAPDGSINTIDGDSEIVFAQSVAACSNGLIAGVTNSGILFFVKGEEIVYKSTLDGEDGLYYTAVGSDGDSGVMVGTSGGIAHKYVIRRMRPVFKKTFKTKELTYSNVVSYDRRSKGYFLCCENGMGIIDASSGRVSNLTHKGFDSSVSDVCVDVQGNIWFASNKQGILRFSWNPFDNVFKKAGMDGDVVNTLLIRGGILYAGTDQGIMAMDLETEKRVRFKYLLQFEGTRIRHMMEDSNRNIWVSTYGPNGLVCIHPDGTSDTFNEQNGTAGGRFRSVIELSDGRILAAGNMGLSFIKDGRVVAALGEEDGLDTPQILSMYERSDGSILAASDGDGIYIIRDDRVAGHIGLEEGLESLVVLRIIPCSDGFLYVTSNSIYHDDGKVVTRLDSFPYSNNYDIFINSDGMCWITSSAGLYIVPEEELLRNGDYRFILLNRSRGLSTTFTANSWNVWYNDMLYLCCTDGMRRISPFDYNSYDTSYPISISSIKAGEETVRETNGEYTIPAVKGRIQIDVAVLNYTFSNPLLHVYLEGSEDVGTTCFQNELAPLSFTNLPGGKYTLIAQVLNESKGEVVREERFPIIKEAFMYERLYFRLYLALVCILLLLFAGWFVANLRYNAERIRGLQLEVATDRMTGLMNKNAAELKLRELCNTSEGTLLMIDLDSFKLVNDIYGHDMGDRILVRFSELIKEAIGEDSVAGRMGGDEFIAFIRGECDEDRMKEISALLNDELMISAKEYMGEDMEIPLGASVGAVGVPDDEGRRDYGGIFRKADKALYMVKQNGKHGFAFYRKNAEEKKILEDKASIQKLMTIMGERGETGGAYFLELDEMQVVYRYFVRYARRNHAQVHLVRLTIKDNARGEDIIDIPEPIIEGIGELVANTLRETDIMTRNGRQYLVLLTVRNRDECIEVIRRILSAWDGLHGHEDYSILYEIEHIKTTSDRESG